MMHKVVRRIFRFLYYILLLHIVLLFSSILPNIKLSNRIRGFLVKPFLKKCGKNLQVARGVTLIQTRCIEVGDNVYIAHDVWINGTGGLKIGSGVIISPKVVIATTKHHYENGAVSNSKSELAPVYIGDGSWIASNCTVTKGVSIGKGCIIGACSSVTKDIPDYVFAGGVPAKQLKKLA